MSLVSAPRMKYVTRELNSSDSKLKKRRYRNKVSKTLINSHHTNSVYMYIHVCISITWNFNFPEKYLYADLWEKDIQAKSAREEMESALQLERNKELLKVCYLYRRLHAHSGNNDLIVL